MKKESDDLIIRPQRAKVEDGYKTFSIRIKEETVSRIEDVSAQTGHTRNELIGMFLEYALEHCTVEKQSCLQYACNYSKNRCVRGTEWYIL